MTFMNDIKRKLRSYTACVNFTLVFILASLAALILVITAIVNIDGEACEEMVLPRMAPSPFWCVLFWTLKMAIFGAALGIAMSVPTKNGAKKGIMAALGVSGAIICYSWISLVYSAQSFLLAALVCAVLIAMSFLLFSMYKTVNPIAAVLMMIFCAWLLYIFYFSTALAFLS